METNRSFLAINADPNQVNAAENRVIQGQDIVLDTF